MTSTAAPPSPSATPPTGPPPARSKRRRLLAVAVAGVAVAGVAFLIARLLFGSVTPHFYAGTVLQGATPAAPMDGLVYANGDPVDLADFEDDVVLVYFGYTNCPDICPTLLSAAGFAIDGLSESERERVHLLMVSVDPERDDLASLQEYVEFFHPSFAGVGGDVVDIDRVASLYGVFYSLGEGTAEEGYLVDHTATLAGIAPDGSLRIVWPPNVTAEDLNADMKELL